MISHLTLQFVVESCWRIGFIIFSSRAYFVIFVARTSKFFAIPRATSLLTSFIKVIIIGMIHSDIFSEETNLQIGTIFFESSTT